MTKNHLVSESSPYLLQHARNPVDWYPWGKEALDKARRENKMLIISIGYAACHWCHVMEKESFEDPDVAVLMNKYFVSVKVDREERPDVDQVYMNAVHLTAGQGGWPLNAFALPDGRPVYAGTYFRKADWIRVLEYFAGNFREDPEVFVNQAERITAGLKSLDHIPRVEKKSEWTVDVQDKIFGSLKGTLDWEMGGMNRAPKFPMPSVWEYLLHYHYLSHNDEALQAVTTTLDHMALGGIYDHVGGGFARYSTDTRWHVPHFEKMLYDNAQLVSLYARAWQHTKNPLFKEVVYETLGFIAREMTSEEGGFYSSLDADSEGEEGKFYTWTRRELEAVLGEQASLFAENYLVTEKGNWEQGTNILQRISDQAGLKDQYNLSETAFYRQIKEAKKRLLAVREKRVRPALDDKILTSWNALMLKGYVDAYRAFGEQEFLSAALRNAGFLEKHAMSSGFSLMRNHKYGKSTIPGFLDDYAFTIAALIALYQADFDEHWMKTALELCQYAREHFYDEDSAMFFYTHDRHADLIVRNMERSDNVIPASNSEMAKNLFVLGQYFHKPEFIGQARQMLSNVSSDMEQNLFYFSNWGILSLYLTQAPFEVAIVGEDSLSIRKEFDRQYLPGVLFSGGKGTSTLPLLQDKLVPGQTSIYVCRDGVCQLPVTDVASALENIRNY